MKISIKDKKLGEFKQELKDINGKFEIAKHLITRGNMLNFQLGDKSLSIKL